MRERENRILLDIGERLRNWGARKPWEHDKDASLAKFLKVDPSFLSKILSGQDNLTLLTLQRLLDHFKITLDEFFLGRYLPEIEKQNAELFALFRDVIAEADKDVLATVHRDLTNALRDARDRAGPERRRGALSSI